MLPTNIIQLFLILLLTALTLALAIPVPFVCDPDGGIGGSIGIPCPNNPVGGPLTFPPGLTTTATIETPSTKASDNPKDSHILPTRMWRPMPGWRGEMPPAAAAVGDRLGDNAALSRRARRVGMTIAKMHEMGFSKESIRDGLLEGVDRDCGIQQRGDLCGVGGGGEGEKCTDYGAGGGVGVVGAWEGWEGEGEEAVEFWAAE